MMLAVVPTSDVPDVFNQLVETIPDTIQVDPLLGYFERTWIAGLNGRAASLPSKSVFPLVSTGSKSSQLISRAKRSWGRRDRATEAARRRGRTAGFRGSAPSRGLAGILFRIYLS